MSGRRVLLALFVSFIQVVFVVGVPVAAEFSDPDAGSPDVVLYSPAFADVEDGYLFAASIRALFESGITVGCNAESTHFCPEDVVTREQMAAFFTRALDLPPADDSLDFVDDDGSIFESDIESLAAAGITRGCNPPINDRFCPKDVVTRDQMAAFFVRALNLPDEHPVDFVDDDGNRFESEIERLAAADITRGCNPPLNNRFCPTNEVTRGQMAAFFTRALDLPIPAVSPEDVTLTRTQSGVDPAVEIELEVCRDSEVSVMTRSAVTGSSLKAFGWAPTGSALSAGELDSASDRWFLPTGEGCETLAMGWDPRANQIEDPLDVMDIVSGFGPRLHPILGYVRLHAGIDLDGEIGDPIYAVADGVVVDARSRGGYGLLVDIHHPGGLLTRYAHMSQLLVSAGDEVQQGDVIGLMGSTGLSTGPHLHFETREWDVPVDPIGYLP